MLEPNIVYDIAKKLNNNERNISVLMRVNGYSHRYACGYKID